MTGQWVPTGHEQRIDPDRILNAEAAADAAIQYARKSRTHLWIATLAHRATDQALDAIDGRGEDGSPILDADTLFMRPVVGCYVCEQPYERRERHRRCPGEPRHRPAYYTGGRS